MAKRGSKRPAKPQQRRATAASPAGTRIAAQRRAATPNFLGVIRGAIAHKEAHPIFGKLSGDDFNVLSTHLTKGTLMAGLTPIADTSTKADAVNGMPSDIGKVISKLSDDDVKTLRGHLSQLDRDENQNLVCGC